MRPEFAAHTPPATDPTRWHELTDHSWAVAELAGKFADSFGGKSVARLLGLTHDVAKANPAFQRYLDDCAAGLRGQSVPHAAPGAAASSPLLKSFALAILGHHAGLHDRSAAKGKIEQADSGAVQ